MKMKPTSFAAVVLIGISPAHSLSVLPPKSLKTPPPQRCTATKLQAQTFTQNPWGFLRFPAPQLGDVFRGYGVDDAGVSLLSLEGGVARSEKDTHPSWSNLLSVQSEGAQEHALDEALATEMNMLAHTFADLQSSINWKSQLYDQTFESYQSKIANLQEENSFLEEGMRMLTVTVEKQTVEIQRLQAAGTSADMQKKLEEMEEENEMLRSRVRGLEVELSDVAFVSRKILEPVPLEGMVNKVAATEETEAVSRVIMPRAPTTPIPAHIQQQHTLSSVVDTPITPKTPSIPIPSHIQQQRLEQLQKRLQIYEEERSSLRKLVKLCFCRGAKKVGRALDLWRPIYLVLADARKGRMV